MSNLTSKETNPQFYKSTYQFVEVRGRFQGVCAAGSRVRMHSLGELIKAGLDFRFRGVNFHV
jgi:hypothetical protein